MKEFFIKGRKVRPGLTITNGWRTYVVTNEYKLHYVESGNHAEVHVLKEEMWSIREYFSMRPLLLWVDALKRIGRKTDRKLNSKE